MGYSGEGSRAAGRPLPKSSVTGYIPGILLCAAVALPSFELSRHSPSLDALALSLILGIVLGNVLGTAAGRQPGVRLVGAVFIPAGIILYGTRLDFLVFARMPVPTVALVLSVVAIFFITMLALSRPLGVGPGTAILVASGSAICGASAIAVLAPVVDARHRDTSMALIVITTVGLTGVLVYPLLADLLELGSAAYGVLCGSTLQQTGIVKLAASHMGDAALAYAMPVKMLRIAALAPAAVALGTLTHLPAAGGYRGRLTGTVTAAARRAWFIPVFIAVALVFTFQETAAAARESFYPYATLCLSMALASIGLGVDFESIRSLGSRPLLLAFAGWLLVAGLVLTILSLVTR